ncbi:MAG: ureidoglycolate lyase [Gammaproteobacteria bacterium]|nr:ureidoglycolate lyase [Gammaproteobacteria bacterium]
MAEREIVLRPQPLTRQAFAPFGDVIEASEQRPEAMNEARFERFDDLCNIDLVSGRPAISIARCVAPSELPLRVERVERHPLGSQAFVPLQTCRMVIVVGPPGDDVDAADLRAFVTRPRQGFNYHRGTWHMPLIAFADGDQFLVIDRGGAEANYEEILLDDIVMLEAG